MSAAGAPRAMRRAAPKQGDQPTATPFDDAGDKAVAP
jgi:hypothetical protein